MLKDIFECWNFFTVLCIKKVNKLAQVTVKEKLLKKTVNYKHITLYTCIDIRHLLSSSGVLLVLLTCLF